jgi:hypothetical protein
MVFQKKDILMDSDCFSEQATVKSIVETLRCRGSTPTVEFLLSNISVFATVGTSAIGYYKNPRNSEELVEFQDGFK